VSFPIATRSENSLKQLIKNKSCKKRIRDLALQSVDLSDANPAFAYSPNGGKNHQKAKA